MLAALLKGSKVSEDLDEFYPLRKDVEVSYASKYRPRRRKRLSGDTWRECFDSEGRWVRVEEALDHIRRGGVDPRIRPEVWEFLLGVFDPGSTRKEREALRASRKEMYMNLKTECNLVDPIVGCGIVVDFPRVREDGSDVPVPANTDNPMIEMLDMSAGKFTDAPSLVQTSGRYVPVTPITRATSDAKGPAADQGEGEVVETREKVLARAGTEKVRKWRLGLHQIGVDVMRADRTLQFYEDDGNRARLMEVLALHSWFDSEVGYCQGMGDLMSPLVVLFNSNADAFWCFERLMRRVRSDFIGTSSSLGVQAEILRLVEVLKVWDAPLFLHLDDIGAGSLFFTVRSIMTMFRRELSFADALYLWEMQWAWEFDLEAVRSTAAEDRKAIRSVSRHPTKASSRQTFLEDEAAYTERLREEQARLARESGEGLAWAEENEDLAGLPVFSATPGTMSGDMSGEFGSFQDPHGVPMSGPMTAKERTVAERRFSAYPKLDIAGTDREDGGDGAKGAAEKPDEAEAEAGQAEKKKGGSMRFLSMPRGTLRKEQLLQALERGGRFGPTAGNGGEAHGGEAHGKLVESKSKAFSRGGFRATIRRKLTSSKTMKGKGGGVPSKAMKSGKKSPPALPGSASEAADGGGGEDQGLTGVDASMRLTRLNSFCVLAVLIHAREDLFTCDGMDDVVDVYNGHASEWGVKDLCKAAYEQKLKCDVLVM